jgi:histidinol-phosphate aminotransferase
MESIDGIKPPPGLAGVQAYSVPRHGAPTDLKLDANEGEACSPALLERLVRIGPDIMRRYPSATEVQNLLAARLGVASSRVIVTAGADDALDRLCRAALAPGRFLLQTDPSFEMLARYARLAGAEVEELPWTHGPFPTDAFLAAIRPETGLVAIVTPNNPTGITATRDDIARIARAATHCLVLVDLAYVEFANDDPTAFALQFPNVIVTRTLSKAWGLAGLRVGYAIGHERFIGWMRAAGGPYAVSRPSLALAAARLETDGGETARFCAQVRADRDRLHALLDRHAIGHTASEANFAFVQTERALWIRDALAGLGIAIRAYPGHPRLGAALRITCPGDEKECDRLLAAMEAAIAPQALVVGLLGTLVDPTRARVNTLARVLQSVGAPATARPEDLLAGAPAEADEAALFAAIAAARPGVQADACAIAALRAEHAAATRAAIRPVVELPALAALARRIPLAVVTRLARPEAEEILAATRIAPFVSALVTAEDAADAPAPDAVRLALGRLGLTRGWFIGTDPAQMAMARAAGAVPIGIVPRGTAALEHAQLLTEHGAARVLAAIENITEILP